MSVSIKQITVNRSPNGFAKIFKEKMKKLNYYKFRKMAEVPSSFTIVEPNWASYQVYLKNGTEANEGKVKV